MSYELCLSGLEIWIGTDGSSSCRSSTCSSRGGNFEWVYIVTGKVQKMEFIGEIDAQGCNYKLDDNVGGVASRSSEFVSNLLACIVNTVFVKDTFATGW